MDNPARKAIDFILTNASKFAQAKATRVQLEEYRKSKKAILANLEEGSLGAKEMYAYAHPDYMTLLMGLKAAVATEEELKWRMEAAKLRFEHYKVECFNTRVEARAMS